ncbi:ATP-binding protein [Litorimonas sp. RW-G-Af-16]|uniref:sensor histidine kinase n=1 Tax=Litorimonas sp. RW-G-Af-16 TaxID=3241168 RepID=UPI00390C954E
MLPDVLDMQFWITVGSVILAVLACGFALRTLSNQGKSSARWKQKSAELDRQVGRFDSIFGTYPGLILVWEEAAPDPNSDWGKPRLFGSPAALASMMRFAEAGKSKDTAQRVLNGLADLNTISESVEDKTLRTYIAQLRTTGTPFSISIVLPEGNVIEVDGRVAGRQVVLWLEDSSIRGEDERTAISRFETNKITAEVDPVAFIEMMSRAPFPLWRMSGSGRLNWVNAAYIDAVKAANMRDVLNNQIHLDEKAASQAKVVLQTHERVEDVRNIVLAGQNRATAVSLFPVSGGVAGIATDATETHQLRQALSQQVRAHDELLNAMDEAVVIFGPNQKMRFHNKAFAQLFGIDEGWFKGAPSHGYWLDHLRERELLPAQADYQAWKTSELQLYTEWPEEMPDALWGLPDGRTLRLVRMRDPQGGISLMFSDMTDALTLKGQLGTLINVQGATLDRLSEGIAVFGTDGRLKIHNAAFARMWELSDDDLKDGPRFSDLIERCLPLYHDQGFWDELKARATDPNPDVRRQVEGEIRRSDDKMLTWLSKPLPDGATLVAWDDVTSSRRAEAALIERAEALEEADRMKSEFVGHVSYQLRTPLTTISGYSDFLQNGGAGEMNDKQSEYVFAIQSASEDLAKIIDDILDIAAIEANVLDLDLGDVDVYAMLNTALDYVATKADDTKISLDLKCSKDIGKIRADETRLKQVVYNLLSNALRFTKPGGVIELGAEPVASGIKLWVKDDGVGIPSDRQGQVFESFESSRGGAGLGLALVQRFVERHGGWVELESQEGEGTHVTCYLPKEAATDSAHPELFADAQ